MSQNERGAGQNPQSDGQLPVEHLPISPADLLDDNRSKSSREKNDRWRIAYETRNAYLEINCSDARVVIDEERVVEQSSVATGFPHKRDYSGLYNDPRFVGIVIKTHFDGDASLPGMRPVGCGGQDTKAAIRQGNLRTSVGSTGFVDANVHEDPLVQGFLQAQNTAHEFNRDGILLVVTMDHRRALVEPAGEYVLYNGVDKRTTPRQLRDVLDAKSARDRQGRYRPELIYAQGIPIVQESDLTDESAQYLEISRHRMIDMLEAYPDFGERQRIQNPFALAIVDSKIPLQVRYPGLFSQPGSVFRVHIPRTKEEKTVYVEPKSINAAIDQIHYAVTHSVQNHDNPDAPFSNSRLVFIETADIGQSMIIADRLLRQRWMQQWHALEGHSVMIAESRAGNTLRVDELPKAA